MFSRFFKALTVSIVVISGLLSSTSLFAYTPLSVPTQAIIHERLFAFSDYYEIDSDVGSQGNLIKAKLALWTSYQYYDQEGQHAAAAYLRIFSLGTIYTWAGVLDVYDHMGDRVGLIEGAILTFLPSKFSIYNAQNCLVGTAYMDHDCMGFTVSDPINELRTLANFRRNFIKDVTDNWVITINDPEAIDLRLLYSFGAFVLDNQNDFRIDD